MIRTRETTINYKHLTICTHRTFAFDGLNWYVTVDNMTMFAYYAKFVKNIVANSRISTEFVIWSLYLFLWLFICEKITFEVSHLMFIKRWRIWSCPPIPHIVKCYLILFSIFTWKTCNTNKSIYFIKIRLA